MPQIAGFRGAVPTPAKAADMRSEQLAPGLVKDGVVARDASRAMYRYHQIFGGAGRTFTRKSLFCAVQLTPYAEGQIRPHEHASKDAVDAYAKRARELGAYENAVVMGFRDPSTEVERLCRKHEANKPSLEFKSADGTQHRLWRISEAETIGAVRRYFTPKKLHVLEHHDRYEAMLGYRDELAAKHSPPMYSSANFGLACLTSLDDPALVTAPRHRIIKGTGAKRDAVFAALGNKFIVEKLPDAAKDVDKQFAAFANTVAHQPAFVIAFANESDAWKLTLSPDISPVSEGVKIDRALQKLDPVVLQYLVVDRAFAGAKTETSTDASAALAWLAMGADAVVITRPLSVEQIAHVDELGGMLPVGSTAFHPPLAANIVGYIVDPDEDVV